MPESEPIAAWKIVHRKKGINPINVAASASISPSCNNPEPQRRHRRKEQQPIPDRRVKNQPVRTYADGLFCYRVKSYCNKTVT